MEKYDLAGVPETMLQTMYARAMETEKPDRHITDEKAVDIVKQMDYDFSKASTDSKMYLGVIARTIVLDRMVTSWLAENEHATVINIACGLDTRCYRMEGRFDRWYNLDLPETIDVRRRFIPEEGKISQIALSATDPEWADNVEKTDDPVLVIIEGLTMYLTESDVRKIFDIIRKDFPKATVFVETMSPFVVKNIKEKSIEGSHAKFSWGVKSGKELEGVLKGWKCLEEHSLVEGMQEMMPVYKLLGKIGFVRNISNKILLMKR